jgi:hypothetical protein
VALTRSALYTAFSTSLTVTYRRLEAGTTIDHGRCGVTRVMDSSGGYTAGSRKLADERPMK